MFVAPRGVRWRHNENENENYFCQVSCNGDWRVAGEAARSIEVVVERPRLFSDFFTDCIILLCIDFRGSAVRDGRPIVRAR